MIALLFYDYFITIEQERKLIWGHQLSIGTFLFFSNRYLNIFAAALELFQQGRFNTPEVFTRP